VERLGDTTVQQWRRSFSVRPPGGESLADTAARTVPFFEDRIMSHVRAGDNILVSAHGNSLRSIVMHLDNLDEHEVAGLELATAVSMVYDMDTRGRVMNKTLLES
jgi:2,3-bisphosphoglycerate-dependent phosphoglycerate mutase